MVFQWDTDLNFHKIPLFPWDFPISVPLIHTISRWESLQDTGAIQVHPMEDIDAKDYEAGVFRRCGKPFVFPQDSLQMDDFPLDCVVLTHICIYVCVYIFYSYLLIERFIYIAAPTCSKNVSIHLLISPKWLVVCPCHLFRKMSISQAPTQDRRLSHAGLPAKASKR